MTALPTTQGRTTPTTSTTGTTADLETRLALADAAMTVRLADAALAYDVNSAHIPTDPVDLADVVTTPITPDAPPAPNPYTTPAAALLHRAYLRISRDGWCTGTMRDEQGAVCLYGALHTEASGNSALEAGALDVLMETIRRQFGEVESVPAFNDAFGNGRTPLRMLEQAALLADARGI